MDHQEQSFKEVATQIFGDNLEQKYAALTVLDEQLAPHSAASLEEPTSRLEAFHKNPPWKRWVFYGTGLLISLCIMLYQGWQVNKIKSSWKSPTRSGMMCYPSELPADLFGKFSHEEELILFGDRERAGVSARAKALWDYEPDNAAYYAEYAMAYLEEFAVLPVDFIQMGDKLDPGNAWYRVMAASVLSKDVVAKKKIPYTRSRRGRGWRKKKTPKASPSPPPVKKLPEWEVHDEVKYNEALRLLHEAAALPRFDSYSETMLKKRIAILPSGGDYATRISNVAYLAMTRITSLEYQRLGKVVLTEVQRCGREKDRDSLEKCIASWETLGQGMVNDSVNLVDILVARTWLSSYLPYFRDASMACGMELESKRYAELNKKFKDYKDRLNKRMAKPDREEWTMKAGVLYALSIPTISRQVDDSSSVGKMDLKPGRMADHAFLGRLLSGSACWMFALVALGVFADSFRNGAIVRKLSGSLMGVLDARDWLWIFGGGVLGSFIYYFAINEFSPWSARHYSLISNGIWYALGQYLSLLVLILVLPSLIIRWRLNRVLPMLGLSVGRLSIAAVLCALVAMPAFGMAMVWGDSRYAKWSLYGLSFLLAMALLLLLVNFILLFWGKQKSLRRVLCARSVIPAYLFAAFLFTLCMPLYHAEEKYWVARDEIFELNVDEPGITRVEYLITQQLKKEFKQTMGWRD